MRTFFNQFDKVEKDALDLAKRIKRVPYEKYCRRVRDVRKTIEKGTPTSAKALFFAASVDRVRADLASQGSGGEATKIVTAERLIVEWSNLTEDEVQLWEDKTQKIFAAKLNTFKVELKDMIYED